MRHWNASAAAAARDILSIAQRSARSIALLSDTVAYTISFCAALNGTVSGVSGRRHSAALQTIVIEYKRRGKSHAVT